VREIIVKDQVRLGSKKILRICLNGIYFRLFRSMVTLTIIALAVAFMVNIFMGGLIGAAVHRGVRQRADAVRAFGRWITRFSEEMTWDQLSVELGAGGPGSPAYEEIAAWGRVSDEEIRSLHDLALQQEPYLHFFDGLNPGKRYVLLKGKRGLEALAWLEDEEAGEIFLTRLGQQRSLRLPGGGEGLRDVLARRKELAPLWERVMAGRRQTLAEIRRRWGERTPRQLLAEPPEDFEDVLRELGFRWPENQLAAIVSRAKQEEAITAVTVGLRDIGLRRDLADRLNVSVTLVDLDGVAGLCSSERGRKFFFERVAERGVDLGVSEERIEEALGGYAQRRRILDVAAQAEALGAGTLGFSKRMLWLVGVACLVCIVGIANAMLMSVMERFREIATMKCLGATDGFVLTLFILESCIQGLAGGVVGALLATLLSLPLATLRYGGLTWAALPVKQRFGAACVGVGAGVFLAALASIYPAWFASRLAPMEAMRVE
jgi:hypothetical protein